MDRGIFYINQGSLHCVVPLQVFLYHRPSSISRMPLGVSLTTSGLGRGMFLGGRSFLWLFWRLICLRCWVISLQCHGHRNDDKYNIKGCCLYLGYEPCHQAFYLWEPIVWILFVVCWLRRLHPCKPMWVLHFMWLWQIPAQNWKRSRYQLGSIDGLSGKRWVLFYVSL